MKKIAKAKREDDKINNFQDYQLYIEKEKSKANEGHFKEVDFKEEIVSKVKEAKGVVYHSGHSFYSDGHVEKPEIKDEQTEEKYGSYIINGDDPVFWMGFDEILDCENKFNIIGHYGLKLIVARNRIEKEMLKGLKESHNVLHISELDEKIEIKGTLSNTELNMKERRALMLLDMVSRILGKDHNVFVIGDLMVTKEITIESINLSKSVIEDSVVIMKNMFSDKVYIDRSIVNLSKLKDNLDEKITLEDYQFILANLYNICEAVGLLVKMVDSEIEKTIINALGNGMII